MASAGSERATGGVLERLIFGRRPLVLIVFAVITAFMLVQVTKLRSDAGFEKMIPAQHPYIANFLEHREALGGLANTVRIVVEAKEGTILDADYLETLRQITDEIFYIKGVDRGNLRSLWTPNMRWMAVTAEGFTGGPVIPRDYDGSAESLVAVEDNIRRSNQVGILVANDFKSSVIQAPLVTTDPATGEPLDYAAFSTALEEKVREKYGSDTIGIHITGFAKLVGELIDGVVVIAIFFIVALIIMGGLLVTYTRCIRSTVMGMGCSAIAVVWQLGLLTTLGYGLDPYSVLVPFLIFAIGASHAIQIINATMLQSAGGIARADAARLAFRALAAPGATALLSDSIGFLTLIVIPIIVIKELALAAGLGVAMVLLTNLILLPVLLSYFGVNRQAAERAAVKREGDPARLWSFVAGFSRKSRASMVLAVAALLAIIGGWKATELQIGDLDKGAPELHPHSRYNRDVAFLSENYSNSTDVLVVMVETPPEGCVHYETLALMDQLQWRLENTPGVQGTISIADVAKLGTQGFNEGNLKWRALNRNQLVANATLSRAPAGFFNTDCSMAAMIVFLEDHMAATLRAATNVVEEFSASFDTGDVTFALAAGNAGIEAATNDVIGKAQYQILALVYGVVAVLIMLTFRSVIALVVILVPLALTSVLAQALMASLGMGVKVATLPVIALGVGIGVDYGIYIYDRLRYYLRQGLDLDTAYLATVRTTGHAVAFTGLALAVGVATWIFAPTKFQADMGLMLTFMFVWNMIGALTLLPALMRVLAPKGMRAGL
ncbi:RND family transporter [Rhodobacteraceae bacterium NNCM2]|nr:RND family transporter [Coraliihabitans acroporae]